VGNEALLSSGEAQHSSCVRLRPPGATPPPPTSTTCTTSRAPSPKGAQTSSSTESSHARACRQPFRRSTGDCNNIPVLSRVLVSGDKAPPVAACQNSGSDSMSCHPLYLGRSEYIVFLNTFSCLTSFEKLMNRAAGVLNVTRGGHGYISSQEFLHLLWELL